MRMASVQMENGCRDMGYETLRPGIPGLGVFVCNGIKSKHHFSNISTSEFAFTETAKSVMIKPSKTECIWEVRKMKLKKLQHWAWWL